MGTPGIFTGRWEELSFNHGRGLVQACGHAHIGILKEDTMKSSTKDKAEGTFHEVKGKVKEVVGSLTDNPKLKAEGTGEKMAGKVQEKIGQVKKVLGK